MNNKELLSNGICPCCKLDADFQGYVLHNMPMIFKDYCFEIEDMFDSGEVDEEGSKIQGVYCPHCGSKFTYDGDGIDELNWSEADKTWDHITNKLSDLFVNDEAKGEFFREFFYCHKNNIADLINYVNKKHS